MDETDKEKRLAELISHAVECMGVAVTIIDCKGTLLYYNRHAAKILDRKREYFGTDVRSHHKRAASNEKLDLMLREFEKGRTEPFRYEARPYGEALHVTLSPIVRDDRFVGCVQSVLLIEAVLPEE
jgi:hypothetical protein